LYRRLGVPPTGNVLLESCRLTAPELSPVVRKVAFAEPLPPAEVRFITQELSRYVRFQALKMALRDSVEPLGRGDLDALERGLQTALQIGRRSMDGGERWYVRHVAERLSFSAQESFMAMLIPPLDAVVKVGRQDLVAGLAAPNTGKTFFLLWMMLAAYVQKKTAVFYTLEMPAIVLARRLDSVVAKLNTADLPRARGLVLARAKVGSGVWRQPGVQEFPDARDGRLRPPPARAASGGAWLHAGHHLYRRRRSAARLRRRGQPALGQRALL
jgi:hypothetical protein